MTRVLPTVAGGHFDVAPQPTRVVFGAGRLRELPAEVDRLGWNRVAVLCTPGRSRLANDVAALLGPACVGVMADAVMHVPADRMQDAADRVRAAGADGCVSVGGGSSIGLAKMLARQDVAPYLAIPTTYAGSEMTPVWGLTTDGAKRTGRDERVRAVTVLYDPDLTLDLPPRVTLTSAVNALAHACESLYAPDRSPLTEAMAVSGVRSITAALPLLDTDPHDHTARESALVGAWLCGSCLGATTMGLHHKLCHVLGGSFDLPHAETHTLVLPHVLSWVLPRAAGARIALAAAVGDNDPATWLWQLSVAAGVPHSLAELGLAASAIDHVVQAVLAAGPFTPRNPDAAELRSILEAAHAGAEPQIDGAQP